MEEFIKGMPKIPTERRAFYEKLRKELHAHLNGSLTERTLLEVGAMKYGETSKDFKNLCSKIKMSECSLSECFQVFKIAHDLTSTKECLRKATICAIHDFFEDNVVYLELRTTPKDTEFLSRFEYLECVLDAIRQVEVYCPDIKVKLLPSIDRSRGLESAQKTLDCIRSIMTKYPNMIAGIDFSGNPENGTFLEYKNILQDARDMELKLALHCGEIKNDKEVSEMLEFGMDRCGHGTYINGSNLKLLKKKRIPLECCLTSNVKSQTVLSYFDHHFKDIFETNHPVVLCTDDFAVFDTTLSKELQIACDTYKLSRNDVFVLMQNAIEFSFAEEFDKNDLRHIVKQYCNKWNK